MTVDEEDRLWDDLILYILDQNVICIRCFCAYMRSTRPEWLYFWRKKNDRHHIVELIKSLERKSRQVSK